jgi:hypothetical protein
MSRSVFGKRTVPKHTKVSEETAEILRRLARIAGKTESDFIAAIIEIRCHGLATVEKLQREQWEVVSGIAQLDDALCARHETKRSSTPTGASGNCPRGDGRRVKR